MSRTKPVSPPPEPDLDEVTGIRGIELIYYGHMGLTAEADAILVEHSYGRAHFRALYVVARNPGITANALVAKLKITNQSLARVMSQLVRDRMVVQETDADDRRHRRHHLSPAGAALEGRVLASQFATLGRAFAACGTDAATGFLRVLSELVPEGERALLTYPLPAEVDCSRVSRHPRPRK